MMDAVAYRDHMTQLLLADQGFPVKHMEVPHGDDGDRANIHLELEEGSEIYIEICHMGGEPSTKYWSSEDGDAEVLR